MAQLQTLLRQLADQLDEPHSVARPLLTKKQVAQYLACSESKVDEYRGEDDFPCPIMLGGSRKMLRWLPDEVENWALRHRAMS